MKEFAIYPFEYMNITQAHNQGNHLPHWSPLTNYSDKPWDEAIKDGGRSYFVPQNDFVIEEVLGLNTSTTNSVRLKSVNKLYIPFKNEPDYLYITLTHMNEDNLRQVKKGQVIHKGERILLEGTDGQATGNHFHITANLGKYYGMLKNSNNAWCFTYDKSLLPSEAFYVDPKFTQILNAQGYTFINVPTQTIGTPVDRNAYNDQIEILEVVMNARKGASVNDEVLGLVNKGFYNFTDKKEKDGYTWYKTTEKFWVAFIQDYAKIYPREETREEIIEQAETNLLNRIANGFKDWLFGFKSK